MWFTFGIPTACHVSTGITALQCNINQKRILKDIVYNENGGGFAKMAIVEEWSWTGTIEVYYLNMPFLLK
jgi:hypothetical protein